MKVHKSYLKLTLQCLSFFIGIQTYAQFHAKDTLGHFQVRKNLLVWQKQYSLYDEEALDQALKAHPFSAELDILRFHSSTETVGLLAGENLPEYAGHDFKAFLYVDLIGDRFRITVKQIIFPDFVEKIYWNGMRQADSRGTLEQYILSQDGKIKRNSANVRVLGYFDAYFSQVFDPMAQ